jgi:uncharacterized protein DUF3617
MVSSAPIPARGSAGGRTTTARTAPAGAHMTTPRRLHHAALAGLLLLSAPAGAAEKGTWWEMTTELEMVGMPFAMPATTLRLCQPDGDWRRPPEGKQEGDCVMKDVRTSGNGMKWKMVCTGQEPMEGDGELTRTADTFDGRTHLRSRQGEMNMKMRGKKVGGACDPEELKRKAEAQADRYQAQAKEAKAQADASQARQCDDAIREMQATAVAGSRTVCQDPGKKAAFCARARTEAAFAKLMAQGEMEKASNGAMPGPKAVAKACGLDLAAVQKQLCVEAAGKESLAFLGPWCPAEAKVIAKRECAGRDYTALQGSRYRDFCARLAGDRLEAQADEGAPTRKKKEQEPKEDAVDKGKKLLKGVLGF